MNWDEALSHIQSRAFDVELNVVSGTNAFFKAVSNDPVVLDSLRMMRETGAHWEEVLGCISHLSSLEYDPQYTNPNDTALAVLLWLTRYVDPDVALLGAHYVGQAGQCWYADKLAQQIVNPPPAASSERQIATNDSHRVSSNISTTVDKMNVLPPVMKVLVVSPSSGAFDRAGPIDAHSAPSKFPIRDRVSATSGSTVQFTFDGLSSADAG